MTGASDPRMDGAEAQRDWDVGDVALRVDRKLAMAGRIWRVTNWHIRTSAVM